MCGLCSGPEEKAMKQNEREEPSEWHLLQQLSKLRQETQHEKDPQKRARLLGQFDHLEREIRRLSGHTTSWMQPSSSDESRDDPG
jgi:hypothetical protein